jgi:hypothetical protein
MRNFLEISRSSGARGKFRVIECVRRWEGSAAHATNVSHANGVSFESLELMKWDEARFLGL